MESELFTWPVAFAAAVQSGNRDSGILANCPLAAQFVRCSMAAVAKLGAPFIAINNTNGYANAETGKIESRQWQRQGQRQCLPQAEIGNRDMSHPQLTTDTLLHTA